MTETIPAALLAHMQGAARTEAACIRITRRDGVVVAITDHDQPLDIDFGGTLTYQPGSGFNLSAYKQAADLKAGDIFVDGLADANFLDRAELRAGLFDGAEFILFLVNFSAAAGPNRFYAMAAGRLGKLVLRDDDWRLEFRTKRALYQRRFLKTFQPGCDVELGSLPRCGVPIDAPAWQAATAYPLTQILGQGVFVKPSVFDNRIYRVTTAGTSGGTEPVWNTTIGATTNDGSVVWTAEESWEKRATLIGATSQRQFAISPPTPRGASTFAFGKVKFLTGANAGLYQDIEVYAAGAITTFLAMPLPVAGTEDIAIFPGCDHTSATCFATFDNILAFQGFEFIGGNDLILQYPDAS